MNALPRHRFVDQFSSSIWVLISGVMLGLSFPPFPFWWLAYVALVPLLVRWSRLPLGWMLLREAYSTFLIMAAIAGHWVLFHEQVLTALTSGLGLLLLPVPMTLPVVAAGLAKRRFGFNAGFVVLVTFWLAMEFALMHGPVAMPWLLLGNTQAAATPFNQFADLTGVGGLTLWVWLVNGFIFWTLESRVVLARVGLAAVVIALVAAPVGYGWWRVDNLETSTASLEVGIVQPAVSPRSWSDVTNGARVDLMASLSVQQLQESERGARRPGLLVWPETSLPVYADARRQRALYNRLSRWTLQHNVALLTGAITRYDSAPSLTVDAVDAEKFAQVTPYYNSALLFQGHGRTQQIDKIHMVPFAERVPLVEWRPALAALGVASGGVGAYGLGRRIRTMEAGPTQFGTLICYESIFGDHARQLAKKGAEFLAVLSQDGWWGQSAGYRQHFELSRLRAVETRRAVVLGAVTGQSGLIGPDGGVHESTGWMEQTVQQVSVPLLHEQTYYTLHGDWLGRAALVLALLLTVTWGFVTLFFPRWRVPSERTKRAQPPRKVFGFRRSPS
ncbi:MAG: apolipoprotein N-acyltransferase [Bacteroidota bacterium]